MADRDPETTATPPAQEEAPPPRMPFTGEDVRRLIKPLTLPPREEYALACALSTIANQWARGPMRTRNPDSEARGARIAKALAVLGEDLPAFIEANDRGANRILFGGPQGYPHALQKLLSAVKATAPAMQCYLEHGGAEAWHALARTIACTRSGWLHGGGVQDIVARKAAIGFVQDALDKMGVKVGADAVRKALR